MNRTIHFLLCVIMTIFLSNCQKDTDSKTQINNPSTTHSKSPPMKTNIKITKINTKKEIRNDGNFNQMTLFEVDDNISLEELKNYCTEVKPDYQNGYFQVLVFFKKADAAKFPDNSLTGMYMEDEDLKNIKSSYTINNINGYSKLSYYENNNLESIVQSIDID